MPGGHGVRALPSFTEGEDAGSGGCCRRGPPPALSSVHFRLGPSHFHFLVWPIGSVSGRQSPLSHQQTFRELVSVTIDTLPSWCSLVSSENGNIFKANHGKAI